MGLALDDRGTSAWGGKYSQRAVVAKEASPVSEIQRQGFLRLESRRGSAMIFALQIRCPKRAIKSRKDFIDMSLPLGESHAAKRTGEPVGSPKLHPSTNPSTKNTTLI